MAVACWQQRAVTVERWHGKGWTPVGVSGLLLRANCRPDPKTRVLTPPALAHGCITLAPRKTFRSQPWLGTLGDAQCACERCRPARPGTYRYLGQSCGDRKSRIYSAVFRVLAPSATRK